MEAYSYRYDELTASRTKMAQPDMPELVVGSQLTGGSGYRIDYALVGYLTQALYDYQNKYFFSASFRRDGSSRFAPETRWGTWSLGTSWRIDRESFMASTANWLSALTLKMSYGAQGNDNWYLLCKQGTLYHRFQSRRECLGFRPYGYSEPEMGDEPEL